MGGFLDHHQQRWAVEGRQIVRSNFYHFRIVVEGVSVVRTQSVNISFSFFSICTLWGEWRYSWRYFWENYKSVFNFWYNYRSQHILKTFTKKKRILSAKFGFAGIFWVLYFNFHKIVSVLETLFSAHTISQRWRSKKSKDLVLWVVLPASSQRERK